MSERADIVERAVGAYLSLSEVAEAVEDEWQYVTDLTEAYSASLGELAEGSAPEPGAAEAVDAAIAEIALITDPHRAIDWLSTFPHVVALALGGDVDAAAGFSRAGDASERDDLDDDSPFRALLRRPDR